MRAQHPDTDSDQSEEEVVSQSLRSLTPSASTSIMNAPRRSSRLGTPRLTSVTTSAASATADTESPRSRRASARASTRPPSSNSSLKSPSSLRGLKNVSAESLTSLRSSPRLNPGGGERLNRTTTQAKRRKTAGTSSLISHSEMTDVLDLPGPSSTSLTHEAVDTPASQGLTVPPATQDAISLPGSQAQELLVNSQHPASLSDSHDPAPEPASLLFARAPSLAPAADQTSSVQPLQEGTALPTIALSASSTCPSISISPERLSIPQRSLQTSTSKEDTPISESQTDQLDASKSNSRVATPTFIPQEARPLLDSREEHGALRIQTSKEPTPTSESQTDQLEISMPTSHSATPTSKSQETRPSLDFPENITAFSSAEQVRSTSNLPDHAQLPNSNAPEPASTVKIIVQQSPDSKAKVDIGSTHGQRSGDTVVIEAQPSHARVGGNVQVESKDPTHEKRPEVHAPEAGSSKPVASKRAPRARRAPKWEPSTIPVEDDEDFFNLAPRTTVQFVSKTLGLRPGDRRSASATAPSSGVEAISPQRPPKVIDLSDDDEDSNPNPDVQSEIGSDEESEEESGAPSTRKSRKKKASHAKLPTWTQAKKCDAISLGSSSDDELNNGKKAFTLDLSSDDSDDHTDKKGKRRQVVLASSSKKKPVPRCPTPPPPVNPQIITGANIESRTNISSSRYLHHATEEANYDMDDDSFFATIEGLDPALAQATRELKNVGQASSHPLTGSHVGTQSKWTGHEIQLSINLVFDPRKIATSSPEHRAMYEQVLTVEIGTREEFSKVYEFVKAMNPHLPPHFVIARDHSKLSPFVTPESVHIITDTSLKAYEIDVWNYIKANPDRLAEKPAEPNPLVSTNMSGLPANPLSSRSAADEHEAEEKHEGTITIRVRSGKEEGLEMLVKPTTKMSAIARQFIKQIAGGSISDDQVKNQLSRCRLEFDGEHLDLSKRVQETEIEDGEMVDIAFD